MKTRTLDLSGLFSEGRQIVIVGSLNCHRHLELMDQLDKLCDCFAPGAPAFALLRGHACDARGNRAGRRWCAGRRSGNVAAVGVPARTSRRRSARSSSRDDGRVYSEADLGYLGRFRHKPHIISTISNPTLSVPESSLLINFWSNRRNPRVRRFVNYNATRENAHFGGSAALRGDSLRFEFRRWIWLRWE